jgi:putative ubiquitin-RnfH superfamily antitoxin RatB of RatAB toxin-antitoxin module
VPPARGEGDGINRGKRGAMREAALRVSVVYCTPQAAWTSEIDLADGATVGEAIEKSGVLAAHPELQLPSLNVGVFSRPRSLEAAARDGDRIEIYRPLLVDPKEARRHRAQLRRRKQEAAR